MKHREQLNAVKSLMGMDEKKREKLVAELILSIVKVNNVFALTNIDQKKIQIRCTVNIWWIPCSMFQETSQKVCESGLQSASVKMMF